MNMYEHYLYMSHAHDTCMHVEFFMNTYRRERSLPPALNLGMWHYGAELVHVYMSTC